MEQLSHLVNTLDITRRNVKLSSPATILLLIENHSDIRDT